MSLHSGEILNKSNTLRYFYCMVARLASSDNKSSVSYV
jgi:hypothetical protein